MKFYLFGFDCPGVFWEGSRNTNMATARISYMLWELICK